MHVFMYTSGCGPQAINAGCNTRIKRGFKVFAKLSNLYVDDAP